MFRIPSFGEIAGLFLKTKSVASATSAITGTVSRLKDVADHHSAEADHKSCQARALMHTAASLETQADSHAEEATRAASVQAKLSALLS